ncbi:kinetochore Sim4 complex subunit FTA2-domain-containing protein [Diaporthe sp. PMI_573]|nr:kinetochore Sim4 complex subunit FTA2-domain-containing protein [Diaporthaceae sp. PMI_573]
METEPESPLPLPRVQGPKLEPFRGTASAEIQFLQFLGTAKDLDSRVWKVRIGSNIYALKIFGFQNWEFLEMTSGACIMLPHTDPLHRPNPSPQDFIDYLDPFNCECRAYGRLKQEDREDLAVRVYGYITLTREQEKAVTEASGEEWVDWEKHPKPLDCDGIFQRWETHRHQRLRAIVKEYIPSPEPWTASQIPQMYTDLETLHALGILVRDIHPGNYLGGKLVDFSRAWTMYHICLDRSTPGGLHRARLEEPSKFEEMIDMWAFIEGKEIEKPAGLLRWHSREDDDLGVDPRQYDWRKWKE